MEPNRTAFPRAELLAAAFAFGAPIGGLLIILSWWLLTPVAAPAAAGEYALVVAYLLSPVWAPLIPGFAALYLAERVGWDWRSA